MIKGPKVLLDRSTVERYFQGEDSEEERRKEAEKERRKKRDRRRKRRRRRRRRRGGAARRTAATPLPTAGSRRTGALWSSLTGPS